MAKVFSKMSNFYQEIEKEVLQNRLRQRKLLPFMGKVLIVDGHSAILTTAWLAEIHASHQESGRASLVKEMAEFQNLTDFHVVIIFDGKGSGRDKQGGNEKDPLVMFSRANETADRVIERIAVQQSRKYDVQVASNDRMVLDSCSVSGAHVMSVKGMWEMIDNTTQRFKKGMR